MDKKSVYLPMYVNGEFKQYDFNLWSSHLTAFY